MGMILDEQVLIRRDEEKLWINSQERCKLRIYGLQNLKGGINKAEILQINKNFIDVSILEKQASSTDLIEALRFADELLIKQYKDFEKKEGLLIIRIANFDNIKEKDIKGTFHRTKSLVKVKIP